MLFDHHNSNKLYKSLLKTFSQHFKLKCDIKEKINTTKGGEKLSWIKKYNILFIIKWGNKK